LRLQRPFTQAAHILSLRPASVLQEQHRHPDPTPAVLLVLLAGLLRWIIVSPPEVSSIPGLISVALMVLGMLVIYPVSMLIYVLMLNGFVNLFSRRKYDTLIQVTVPYAYLPGILGSSVGHLGTVIGFIWSFVAQVTLVSAIKKLSWGRAAAILVLFYGLLLLPFALVALVFWYTRRP